MFSPKSLQPLASAPCLVRSISTVSFFPPMQTEKVRSNRNGSSGGYQFQDVHLSTLRSDRWTYPLQPSWLVTTHPRCKGRIWNRHHALYHLDIRFLNRLHQNSFAVVDLHIRIVHPYVRPRDALRISNSSSEDPTMSAVSPYVQLSLCDLRWWFSTRYSTIAFSPLRAANNSAVHPCWWLARALTWLI